MESCDLAVIGSGPGGYRAAVLGALRGLRVAVVERAVWGGCCLNRGCVPKRAWHHAARLVDGVRRLEGQGVNGAVQADLAANWRRQRAVVTATRESYVDYLDRLGVKRVAGHARLLGAGFIEAGGERLCAPHVVIATGSRPATPAGLARVPGRVLDTDDLFDGMPPEGRRVAIIGSGAVATEFAYIFAMFGLDVVWCSRSAPLAAAGYSEPARHALARRLSAAGVVHRPGSRATGLAIEGAGVRLALEDGSVVEVDWVLVATGRLPCTAGLELDAAGVDRDARGFIRTDAQGRSSAAGVHAIGDVAHPEMTSAGAMADAAVVIGNILEPGSAAIHRDGVPQTIYSALELGRIGFDADPAEAAGHEVATGFASLGANPAARGAGDEDGHVRLLASADDGALLGAEIAGTEIDEMMRQVAIAYGRPDALRLLAGGGWNHPSRGEEVVNACETLAARWGLARHVFGTA